MAVYKNNREEDILTLCLTLGVLGKLVYNYPKLEIYKELARSNFFNDIPVDCQDKYFKEGKLLLSAFGQEELSDKKFTDIESDYVRLFIGGGDPVIAPPWESVYTGTDPLVFQQSTLDVRKFYGEKGLIADKIRKEPDDHIGLELMFISKLAVDDGDIQGAENFFKAHIAGWCNHFCDIVIGSAKTDFFKGIALIMRSCLYNLAQCFNVEIGLQVGK